MLRRRLLAALALASLGCAGPRQRQSTVAPPGTASPSARAVQPKQEPPLGVPLEARAVYDRADHAMLGLVEVDGRTLVVSPETVAPARIDKRGDGYVLHAAGPREAPKQEPRLQVPEMLALQKPSAAATPWQLDAGAAGVFVQLANPWATRLSAGLGRVDLEHVDLRGYESLARIRHYLRLLREQPADGLREVVSGLDPAFVKSKGGVNRYVAENLWMELEELRPAAKKSELPELERDLAMAKSVAYEGGTTLWPPQDDAFLATLTDRLSRNGESAMIREGALMRIDTKDRQGLAGCDLGIILPDPTENRGRPWAPFTPPTPGKLGTYSYVMFVLQQGLPGSCERLAPSEFAYPVRHGVYFFRLFANAQANVRGALFIGYMGAELYVVRGASPQEVMAMLGANSEELSHQAE